MTDLNQTALLKAIADDPADDLPRLAYADWLEENGDTDRATHIRTQLEMAKLSEGSPRHNALKRISSGLEDRHREWVRKPEHAGCTDLIFEQGFINEATIKTPYFLRHAKEIAAEPNLGVTIDISDAEHLLPDLAKSRFINRFRRIHLAGGDVDNAAAILIAAQPGFKNLTGLKLGHTVADAGVRALAHSPHLTNLTMLALGYNGIRSNSILTLADSPNLARLTDLILSGNNLLTEGGTALARSPHLGNLTRLALRLAAIEDTAMAAFAAESCPIKSLRSLNLGESHITGEGITALAGSPNFRHLTELDVSYPFNGRTLASLEAIAQSPHLANLCRLNLNRYGDLGAAGIEALAASPTLQNINQLFLSRFGMGDAGAETLAKSAIFSNLTCLDISENNLTDKGARALAQSPHLANLETLDVRYNATTEEGLLALARGLPNLTQLKYYDEDIGRHAEREITRILDNRREERMR